MRAQTLAPFDPTTVGLAADFRLTDFSKVGTHARTRRSSYPFKTMSIHDSFHFHSFQLKG